MSYANVELGEICDFVRGVTFDGNEVLDTKADGYVPILRAGNIQDELYIHDDLVWVPEKRVSREQYFQINDIAICMASGSPAVLGKTAQLNQAFTGSVGAFCGIVRPKKVDPIYMAYWFKSESFLHRRDDQANGVNIQNLRPTEIKEIQVPIPPLPEQRRIADLLARADRLRRLRRAGESLSGSLLQSVFLEMFGNPRTNPMGWKVEKVGKHIKNIRYGTGSPPDYYEKGIAFIRATNVKQGTINAKGLVYISEEDAKKISKCRISAGDLIVVRSGINSGDCALIPLEYDGAYAAYDLIVEVPSPTNCFINFLINSPFGKETIDTLSRRAGQPHVNSEQIESMKFPFPPLTEQERFARVVRRVESLRGRQAESARQGEQLFQSLLAEAFA